MGAVSETDRGSAQESNSVRRNRESVRDLLAGGISTGLTRMCVAPLDVIKIRFQVMGELQHVPLSANSPHVNQPYRSVAHAAREIVAHEGVRALWKGNLSALMMIVPYGGVQFACFHKIKHLLPDRWSQPHQALFAGAMAGMAATLCTYPLDLIRTRLAVQVEPKKYRGLLDASRQIYREEGLTGFYAGVWPTLIEIVPYIALQFAIYHNSKSAYLKWKNDPDTTRLTAYEALVCGGLAGLLSKLATLPLDNTKKRMQVQRQFFGTSRYTGFIDVMTKVLRTEGLAGFFRGAQASIIKAVPNSGLTFTLFEAAKFWLDGIL